MEYFIGYIVVMCTLSLLANLYYLGKDKIPTTPRTRDNYAWQSLFAAITGVVGIVLLV